MLSNDSSSLIYVGTWCVLIIGWIVVNFQNNLRETRKEIRARIDLIQTWIEETEQQSIKYHTNSRDQMLERSIKSQLSRITKAISIIQIIKSEKLTYLSFQFRCSVTLDNFDTPKHIVREIDDVMIESISGSAQDLINELENSYSQKYHLPVLQRATSWIACRLQK